MRRCVAWIAIVLAMAFAAIIGGFWSRHLRGIWPAFSPAPANIADLIDHATTSTASPTATVTTPPPVPAPAPVPPAVNESGMPLTLPAGFTISIFAKNLGGPRVLAFDPDGNLVVSLTSQGKVVVLPDQNGDGKADRVVTLLSGLDNPHGIAFNCNGAEEACYLYVAESGAVSRYDYNPQSFEAVGRKKLFDLPGGGRHFTRTLQFLSDGRLLVSIGSDCDTCHESNPSLASVQVWDGKTLKPYSTGLRNAVFLTERPGTSETWVTEMGRDYLGDNLPPDELDILQEGKDYGWPICYGQNVHDTVFDKNVYIRDPCADKIPSAFDFQAHSAPLGLAFIPDSWKGMAGDLLVAFHGSWNRTVPTGYKVVHVTFQNGKPTSVEDFITGWLTDKGALGRPTGLVFDKYGTLFIADDKAGVIYRVTRSGS